MGELLFANLIILLKLDYHDITIVDKFNIFVKIKLL
jgi:hypothetical protein